MILEERSSKSKPYFKKITRNSTKYVLERKDNGDKKSSYTASASTFSSDRKVGPGSLRKGSANTAHQGREVCFIKVFYEGFYFKG